MAEAIGREAAKPNPALKSLAVLLGTWTTTGTHPMVPGKTFHGRTSFSWIEGGAFLLMHSEIDEPEIPSGTAILGTDDNGEGSMLYFDEREVSRRYEFSLHGNEFKWWRNDATISQHCTVTIAADGRTMSSRGELSQDGKPWEPDLALSYVKVE